MGAGLLANLGAHPPHGPFGHSRLYATPITPPIMCAVAYVKFDKASAAALAMEVLNGAVLNDGRGPKLKVLLAEEPTQRCALGHIGEGFSPARAAPRPVVAALWWQAPMRLQPGAAEPPAAAGPHALAGVTRGDASFFCFAAPLPIAASTPFPTASFMPPSAHPLPPSSSPAGAARCRRRASPTKCWRPTPTTCRRARACSSSCQKRPTPKSSRWGVCGGGRGG